jgi:hypothetical protein
MAQWKQVVVGRSPPAPNTTSVGGGPVVGSWVEVTGPLCQPALSARQGRNGRSGNI